MKLKKITSALASAGVLALVCASGTAQAGLMAGAMVDITNFRILNGALVQVSTTDLTGLSFTSTMDMQATLNGATTGNISASSSTGPGIDQPATCIGTGCVAPTNFTTNNLFPTPAAPVQGNYAAVDQVELGSPITGLTGYVGLAHVANSAYVGLQTGSGSATTSSNNNLNASWTFTAGFTGPLTFDFDLEQYLQVQVDAAEVAPTFATAALSTQFSLVCLSGPALCLGTTGGQSINILGLPTVSLNAPAGSGSEIFLNQNQHIQFGLPVIAGLRYQLSARIETLADLERLVVPEPGVLALLGLGLLGIGATLRKKAV